MIKEDEIIEVGKFQKTHALKGELNALLEIDSEFFEEGNPLIVYYDGIPVPFYPESLRRKGSESFLIKLQGIDDEKEAKSFVNSKIFVLKEPLKAFIGTEGEEIFATDGLNDFMIFDSEGNIPVGRIVEIDDTTSNILLHIENEEGEKIFIPLVEDWIISLDEANKTIKMEFPEGLIELNKKAKEDN